MIRFLNRPAAKWALREMNEDFLLSIYGQRALLVGVLEGFGGGVERFATVVVGDHGLELGFGHGEPATEVLRFVEIEIEEELAQGGHSFFKNLDVRYHFGAEEDIENGVLKIVRVQFEIA